MKTDKELIAEFMGLTFVTVGYVGTDEETDWQRENLKWFDSHYEFHDHSVGDYAVNIKENIILWQDDLQYQTSWDWLMPVVEKISELDLGPTENNRATQKEIDEANKQADVCMLCIDTPIDVVYKAVAEFIKWYNQQPK